jgi:hypothetical protein
MVEVKERPRNTSPALTLQVCPIPGCGQHPTHGRSDIRAGVLLLTLRCENGHSWHVSAVLS